MKYIYICKKKSLSDMKDIAYSIVQESYQQWVI